MPKLSPTDLAAIYKACEAFYGKDTIFWTDNISFNIIENIISFYGEYEWGNWSEDYDTRQNERIMALLFYATVMQDKDKSE